MHEKRGRGLMPSENILGCPVRCRCCHCWIYLPICDPGWVKGNNIILDAYNANPSSMEAAIRNLQSMDATNKIAIIGWHVWMEDEAEHEHRGIGKLLSTGYFTILSLWQAVHWARLNASKQNIFPTKSWIAPIILKQNQQSTAQYWIEASRGMGLSQFVDFL